MRTIAPSISLPSGHARLYLQCSEVNDTVNVGVGLKRLVEAILLGDVDLDEIGLLAADGLDAVQGLGGGVVQVVGNDDLVARFQQSQGGEGANISGTTMVKVSIR